MFEVRMVIWRDSGAKISSFDLSHPFKTLNSAWETIKEMLTHQLNWDKAIVFLDRKGAKDDSVANGKA